MVHYFPEGDVFVKKSLNEIQSKLFLCSMADYFLQSAFSEQKHYLKEIQEALLSSSMVYRIPESDCLKNKASKKIRKNFLSFSLVDYFPESDFFQNNSEKFVFEFYD